MRVVQFDDFERDLDARKAALGITGRDYVARNNGSRWTDAKRQPLHDRRVREGSGT